MKKTLIKYISNLALSTILPLLGFGFGIWLISSTYVVPGIFVILIDIIAIMIFLSSKNTTKILN